MAPRLINDRLLELFRQEGRSKGRHVSSAIHRIMSALYPDRFGSDPIDQVRANLGNALEYAMIEALAREYPDRYVRPGQLHYQGIYGTPDLWDMWGGSNKKPKKDLPMSAWATVELKCTWASSRRAEDIEDQWFARYWWQLKSYAIMAGMSRGVLIIVFINGDYKGGPPEGMMWMDKWAKEELIENWSMIHSYAQEE